MNTKERRIVERLKCDIDALLAVESDCSSRPAAGGAERQDAANQIAIASEAFKPVCNALARDCAYKIVTTDIDLDDMQEVMDLLSKCMLETLPGLLDTDRTMPA